MPDTWFVYLLRCADDTLYTGVTTDLARRVDEHNHNDRLGARYTRARRPVTLLHCEPAASRSDACKREAAIRKLSRAEKLALTQNTPTP
jgi:putative endonuclease